MSLFSTFATARSGLLTSQIGVQVVSNNIANANTPGYSAQRLQQQESFTYQRGGLTFGTGVRANGIVQSGTEALDEQLRDALSDAAGSGVQKQIYDQLESVLGELGTNDLSTSLSNFFGALNDVVNSPESAAVRRTAVRQGEALAAKINTIESGARKIQKDINTEIKDSAGRINQLLEEVSALNSRIVKVEGGGNEGTGAASLRDTRRTALKELSSLIDIKVSETRLGNVNITTTSGDSLINGQDVSRVQAENIGKDGFIRTVISFEDNGKQLSFQSGRLAGLTTARDEVVENFLADFSNLSKGIVGEFNKIYSSGQGLKGFDQIQGLEGIQLEQQTRPLDQAGLAFPPNNGSFQILLRDKSSGATVTNDIRVELGGPNGTTLKDLVSQLNDVEGISASIDYAGRVQISSDSSTTDFSFANDSSGILSGLGINTFFTGSVPGEIGINQAVQDDPELLAASTGGPSQNADNIVSLAQFVDKSLNQFDGSSIRETYEAIVGDVAQKAAQAQSLADGFNEFLQSVEGEALSISGVNLDEEAVELLKYQRAYQASARVIQTINELFEELVRL